VHSHFLLDWNEIERIGKGDGQMSFRGRLECRRFASIATVGLLLAGCSGPGDADYAKLNLVDITGTVMVDGVPVEGVEVRFEDNPFQYSFGVTDASGNYKMMLNNRKSGVTPGSKKVRFVPKSGGGAAGVSDAASVIPQEGDDGEARETADGDVIEIAKDAAGPGKVPACYNSDPKISVEVSKTTPKFDFDLKSDCSTSAPK
jgi:hypothetical protein